MTLTPSVSNSTIHGYADHDARDSDSVSEWSLCAHAQTKGFFLAEN